MDEKLLIEKYPVLYHMAEQDTWPSIEKHGLLSTEALLDLLGANTDERLSILSSHRPRQVVHRGVRIRDQKPMPYGKLASALKPAGINPRQWFELLNGKVFFWTSLRRLENFRSAYESRRQLLIEVPTSLLVEAHKDEITLCPINSGAVRMPDHYRSFDSFQPIDSFEYSSKKKPAELTATYAVKDVCKLASKVSEVGGDYNEAILYSK